MVPLALLPAGVAAALWTAVSVAALAAVIALVLREVGRPSPGWLVALLTVGALALEPVWQNLTFGQVNLLLMLAVLVDVVRPDRRWSGLLLGLAAGVKLTPLVFVVLLVLVGRRSAAARAVLVFAATVAVGFVVAPASSTAYWSDRLVDADPRRAAGAGPQPVGVRRPHPVARRRAPDAAVAGRRRRCCRWLSLVVAARWWLRRRPGARHLPRRAGDADRLADRVVPPLGLGRAVVARAVGAQPGGRDRLGGGLRGPSVRVAAVRRGPRARRGPGPSTSSATPT